MKKIGYLRVSTVEQRPDRQVDALSKHCDELHVEKASAATLKRPIFELVLKSLEPGSELIILDLDRAFRSVVDAVQTIENLRQRDVSLKIVNLNIDTNTPSGMLIYTVIASIAQFERELASQRTKEGLAAARVRGKRLGRPEKLSKKDICFITKKIETRTMTLTALGDLYGMAPSSISRAIKRHQAHP
ncbi:recombinase family protein [Roseobacter sp. EG26]|uniref:recombinase family protein n=1 Tax=Roseobacter sp. EG26 TaxID=3412477 RepID=UPI003CE4D307